MIGFILAQFNFSFGYLLVHVPFNETNIILQSITYELLHWHIGNLLLPCMDNSLVPTLKNASLIVSQYCIL